MLPTLILQAHAARRPGDVLRRAAVGDHELPAATLLAPSVTFTENILRGAFPPMSDRAFLLMMRVVIVCFRRVSCSASRSTREATIFKMVENAYKVTLVTAFVPLAARPLLEARDDPGGVVRDRRGLFNLDPARIPRRQRPLEAWPPQLAGFLAAGAAMTAGSLLPQLGGRSALPPRPAPPLNAHPRAHPPRGRAAASAPP